MNSTTKNILILYAFVLSYLHDIPIVESISFNKTTTPVYVLGLYPMEGYWPAGHGLLPASELAIHDINANDEVLGDYELRLVVADTKVSTNGV